ncbi:MAG: UvrB/UvrC motif-containing protein [Planctomycetaceae bacterium]|nr:UvrB/UvrC motif-containing protein [Planctomycetaceae bacterium]MCA9098470.1 UvrB/UvrC motif-containing protein [Planctomycetaceae bacterium]
MKCYRCSNPATLHVTEIIKNVPHELHLCEECAQQYLANPKSAFANAPTEDDEDDIIEEEVQAELEEIDKLVCPNCGISFKEFRSQGRLGCPHDYIAFQEELIPLLENIHGETQHIGRIPKRAPEDSRKQFQIIKLKNDLRQAIAEEMYEKAAELRDEIQKLERELKPT